MLLQRLLRNELRRAINALETITAGKGTTDVVWGGNINPDADIRAMLMSAADESGVRPNRILFGESAWDIRMTSLESQNSAVAFKGAAMAKDELAAEAAAETAVEPTAGVSAETEIS